MKIQVNSGHMCQPEDDPRANRSYKQERQKPQPNRSSPVKSANKSIGVTKCQQGSGNKAYRKNSSSRLELERTVRTGQAGRKCPGFIQEEMTQEQNGLNGCDEEN